ncbi:hypothetical protein WJ542_07850 [Paraburkholderia sp. B3]|uniref:hypothetical protein n=1 Tax=Paraburkholderia sp. B3 TaxID=3134791 RepID=UPI0039828EA3
MLTKMQRGFRAFGTGLTSGKAVMILAKTYGLALDHENSEKVRLIGLQWEGELSADELAVYYITDYIKSFSAVPNAPEVKASLNFLLQQAKNQQARGLIRRDWIIENLSQEIALRSGVADLSTPDIESGPANTAETNTQAAPTETTKIIVNCPSCQQRLRIPSGVRLEVTCAKCSTSFEIEPGNVAG